MSPVVKFLTRWCAQAEEPAQEALCSSGASELVLNCYRVG
jgi:hypothetical protein